MVIDVYFEIVFKVEGVDAMVHAVEMVMLGPAVESNSAWQSPAATANKTHRSAAHCHRDMLRPEMRCPPAHNKKTF